MDARFPKPVKESKTGSWKKCLLQLLTEKREQDVPEDAEKQEGPSPPGLHSILLDRLTRKKSFTGFPRCSTRSSTDVSPRPRNCTSLDISPRNPSRNELASPNGAVFPVLHHRASLGSVASTRPSSVVSFSGGPQQQFSTASSSFQGASTRPSTVVSTTVFRGREGNDGLISSRSSTPWERLVDPKSNGGTPRSNLGTPRAGRLERQSTQTESSKQRQKSLELMTSIDSAAEVASQMLASRDQEAPSQEQGSSQPSDSSSTLDGQGSPPAAPLQPRPSSLRPPGMAAQQLRPIPEQVTPPGHPRCLQSPPQPPQPLTLHPTAKLLQQDPWCPL
ncbi:hypothetical protein DUNSADRAFT_10178 [Dunaliella salina]|uniref:Uncharacterized protein n=1 Tax=Dunaliella salina TaxID=3046 RepID=A0ABQ7GFZ5_DUNSA|nr:hypothetical protein DUNSADRAFT_10178 [Dunaliella salina]|eukprot:KAF5833527.1 hypothetical protein DUNSADRAFT_10178 [Dunaliella salina]